MTSQRTLLTQQYAIEAMREGEDSYLEVYCESCQWFKRLPRTVNLGIVASAIHEHIHPGQTVASA